MQSIICEKQVDSRYTLIENALLDFSENKKIVGIFQKPFQTSMRDVWQFLANTSEARASSFQKAARLDPDVIIVDGVSCEEISHYRNKREIGINIIIGCGL
ncbi:MAG: hypothetical protein M0003_10335 [Acidithiobacillus sp.]|nr:hypothetical protein [Acidithiobacillus sp.]